MHSELSDKFGIDGKQLVSSMNCEVKKLPYRTAKEALYEQKNYRNLDTIMTILFRHIEEKGRFIAKGHLGNLLIYKYRKEVHPELLSAEENRSDSLSFGGGWGFFNSSENDVRHAINDEFYSQYPV